ncbi:methylamine dehydrogenase accessory protein MauD [Candidatus Binatia bacterium]|nr:methylamine dehydrogenase accessory protein MauD [Candidatus Binatia bacterium]
MNEALLISNVLLWLVVLVLAGIVVALARQLGVLYERIAPVGALALGSGPATGTQAPVVAATTLAGATLHIGAPSPSGRKTLVFFLSVTCPVCKSLLPVLRSVARAERAQVDVVLAGDGDPDAYRALVREHGVGDLPCVVSPVLGMTWQVPRVPYAVLLDAAGAIRSKGLVNNREHLESLLEADLLGVGTLQELFAREERVAEDAAR